jgi:hypothetical protein
MLAASHVGGKEEIGPLETSERLLGHVGSFFGRVGRILGVSPCEFT